MKKIVDSKMKGSFSKNSFVKNSFVRRDDSVVLRPGDSFARQEPITKQSREKLLFSDPSPV
jgi:hypothetical protein